MPPKLTHHEINHCREAVSNLLDWRRTQLRALEAGDEAVLSDLYRENVVPCEDEAGDASLAIAIENLPQVIDRLQTLAARLAEILTYCERCGAHDGTVGPVYPDTRWLCGDCHEA